MLGFVLPEEVDQGLDALPGHGVVDGGAQAADAPVSLEVVEPGGLRGGHHLRVLLL